MVVGDKELWKNTSHRKSEKDTERQRVTICVEKRHECKEDSKHKRNTELLSQATVKTAVF